MYNEIQCAVPTCQKEQNMSTNINVNIKYAAIWDRAIFYLQRFREERGEKKSLSYNATNLF